MPTTIPAGRRVVRNRRFQILGAVSLVLAVGFAVLTYIVIVSPGESVDHPGGFNTAGRVLAVGGCVLVTVVFGAFAVGALRVALIIDDTRLVIRNPTRTTVVRWDSRPRFEIRNRRQDVSVVSPAAGPWIKGDVTYRYHEIVCNAGRQHVWIAATSKMRQHDRVDELLAELRGFSNRSHAAQS